MGNCGSSSLPEPIPEPAPNPLPEIIVEEIIEEEPKIKSPSDDELANDLLHSKIRPLLDLFDDLRVVMGDKLSKDLQLPSIAVVGNQSAGKTSVIERLSGISLPSGEGMVTKAPLVLSMRRDDYEFIKIKRTNYPTSEKIIIDKTQVSREIEMMSELILSENSADRSRFNLSKESISLEVRGPKLIDLTLIDLPGIYRLNTKTSEVIIGLEDYIFDLYNEYCASDSCVVVCVMGATEDFGNQLACGWCIQRWDKNQTRSLGVLTKVDLNQNNSVDRLLGRGMNAAKFKLGTIGVSNRSIQLDHRKLEREYFDQEFTKKLSSHDKHNLQGVLGIDALANALIKVQSQNMRGKIPKIKQEIDRRCVDINKDLSKLPKDISVDDCTREYYQLAYQLRSIFEQIANAKQYDSSLHINARIKNNLDQFKTSLQNNSARLISKDMLTKAFSKLDELKGITLQDLLSPEIIKSLNHLENQKLQEPTTFLIESIRTLYINQIAPGVMKNIQTRFVKLVNVFEGWLLDFIEDSHKLVSTWIGELQDMQEYLITYDDEYSTRVTDINLSNEICVVILDLIKNDDTDTFATDEELIAHAKEIIMISKLNHGSKDDSDDQVKNEIKTTTLTPLVEVKSPVGKHSRDYDMLENLIKLHVYRKIQLRKYIDNVSMIIQNFFVKRFIAVNSRYNRCLVDYLMERTNESDSSQLYELIEEDDAVKTQRHHLTDTLKRLNAAKKKIEDFQL